jgi:hypothetical protein
MDREGDSRCGSHCMRRLSDLFSPSGHEVFAPKFSEIVLGGNSRRCQETALRGGTKHGSLGYSALDESVRVRRLFVARARLMLTSALLPALSEKHKTAFGVFFRFQVTDFDLFFGFFSLCHFIFLSYLFGLFVVCVV